VFQLPDAIDLVFFHLPYMGWNASLTRQRRGSSPPLLHQSLELLFFGLFSCLFTFVFVVVFVFKLLGLLFLFRGDYYISIFGFVLGHLFLGVLFSNFNSAFTASTIFWWLLLFSSGGADMLVLIRGVNLDRL